MGNISMIYDIWYLKEIWIGSEFNMNSKAPLQHSMGAVWALGWIQWAPAKFNLSWICIQWALWGIQEESDEALEEFKGPLQSSIWLWSEFDGPLGKSLWVQWGLCSVQSQFNLNSIAPLRSSIWNPWSPGWIQCAPARFNLSWMWFRWHTCRILCECNGAPTGITGTLQRSIWIQLESEQRLQPAWLAKSSLKIKPC